MTIVYMYIIHNYNIYNIIILSFLLNTLLSQPLLVDASNTALKYVRYNVCWHQFTIFLPVLSILDRATNVVPYCSVKKKDIEEDKVKVGQYGRWQGWYAPAPCCYKLRHIVEVPRQSPPAGSKQQARLLSAISSGVLGHNLPRSFPPNQTVALLFPEWLSLIICPVVDDNRCYSQ